MGKGKKERDESAAVQSPVVESDDIDTPALADIAAEAAGGGDAEEIRVGAGDVIALSEKQADQITQVLPGNADDAADAVVELPAAAAILPRGLDLVEIAPGTTVRCAKEDADELRRIDGQIAAIGDPVKEVDRLNEVLLDYVQKTGAIKAERERGEQQIRGMLDRANDTRNTLNDNLAHLARERAALVRRIEADAKQ